MTYYHLQSIRATAHVKNLGFVQYQNIGCCRCTVRDKHLSVVQFETQPGTSCLHSASHYSSHYLKTNKEISHTQTGRGHSL
jgi:hypothetical protein